MTVHARTANMRTALYLICGFWMLARSQARFRCGYRFLFSSPIRTELACAQRPSEHTVATGLFLSSPPWYTWEDKGSLVVVAFVAKCVVVEFSTGGC